MSDSFNYVTGFHDGFAAGLDISVELLEIQLVRFAQLNYLPLVLELSELIDLIKREKQRNE